MWRRALGGVLLAAAWLAGCTSVPFDAQITGVAFSRERLYVPPDAYFEAALVDVTKEGEPPVVLGRQRMDAAGPLPYPLRIPYRQASVQVGGRYEVRAAVLLEGRLLLDAPGANPVLLEPDFRHVDVPLAPVPLDPAVAAAAVPLRQTYWALVEVVGEEPPGPPAEGVSPAHLLLQRLALRASGSGGCNRFVADYVQEGGTLRLSQFQSSLRLCLSGGQGELAFFRRLPAVASFHQQGRMLELRDERGRPLLRFKAQERGMSPLERDEPPMLPP